MQKACDKSVNTVAYLCIKTLCYHRSVCESQCVL